MRVPFMKRNGHPLLTWSCKGDCPLHTEEYNISRAITGLSALLLIASSHKLCMLRPHLNNSSICVCFFLLMPIITITKNKKGDYNKMCVKDNSPLLYSNSFQKFIHEHTSNIIRSAQLDGVCYWPSSDSLCLVYTLTGNCVLVCVPGLHVQLRIKQISSNYKL